MAGRTPLGRRLAMVAGVDLVVTIAGRRHTEVVVEQALDLGLPVLPIPDAGGDSRTLLRKYHDRIASRFGEGRLDACLAQISQAIDGHPEAAASAGVELLKTAKVGRCLVLLPYDREHNRLYTSVIEPAIEKHMIPVRLDKLPSSEVIYTSFAKAVDSCLAMVVDITRLNENVMYEVGYAHGRGLRPLIYVRKAARIKQLPIYFQTLNVWQPSKKTPLDILIDQYLSSRKAARRGPAFGN
jgi:hypothetical protein